MYKLNIIFTIAIIALGSALSLSVDYGIKKNADCKRLALNQSTLLEQAEQFRVRDSLNGASIRVMTLRESEFKDHFAGLNALIKDMGMRVKRVESISETAIAGRYDIETEVRDSVIARPRHDTDAELSDAKSVSPVLPELVQTIRYADPHLTLSGVIRDKVFVGNIVCRDTLTQIVHRIPRKFWFVRWGTKELRQEIVSSNPHTQITYARHIKVSASQHTGASQYTE